MKRYGVFTASIASRFGRLRRIPVLVATVTLMLIVAGCESTNTYPIDYFNEMHYQKSYRSGEPGGLNPPENTVPITGGEINYSFEEAADLENPYGDQVELGEQVYMTNCTQCHGVEGDTEGAYVASVFEGYGATRPADLTQAVGDRTDGELFHIVTNGLNLMPAFGDLLTEEERWAVVEYLRTLED